MKNVIKLSLMVLMAATIFSACKDEAPNGLAVKYLSEKIAAEGGTATFTIYSGSFDKWSIDTQNIDWLQLSSTEGNGETEITVTVLPNEAENDREALVIVAAGDRKIPVIIVQAGAGLYLNVTPPSITVEADERGQFIERDLTVTSNIAWRAEITFEDVSYGEWVKILPDELLSYVGYGDFVLHLRIDNYSPLSPNAPARTAKVSFYNEYDILLKEVVITQNSPN